MVVAFAVGVMSVSVVASCSCSDDGQEKVPYQIVDIDTVEGRQALDSVTAESWLLVEASTGYPIYGRNWTRQMQPASLTKMMTCILALENGHLNDTVYITEDVFVAKNSRVRLNDGYLKKDLLKEMMLFSDNDAAYAIAKQVAGDTLRFCKLMNQKAKDLNMRRTHFANPNGMPNEENYTTAEDLVKLVSYCMRNPRFAEIVATVEDDIPMADGRHMPLKNTNRLLEEYEGCIGVKTGFTNASGGCLAVAARREGVTLYLVLLKSRYGKRFSEAPTILDYGFNVVKAAKKALE